jgi:hypothetical protein
MALECAVINFIIRYQPSEIIRLWAEEKSDDDMGEAGDIAGDCNFVFISEKTRNSLGSVRGQGRQQKHPAYIVTDYDNGHLCMYSCDNCGSIGTDSKMKVGK